MSDSPALLFVLSWCATVTWSDWTRRRIPNYLVAAGLGVAVLCLVFQGQTPLGATPVQSLVGALVALLTMLPLYLSRTMAAGDVKLFAAIGALAGFWALLPVWLVASVLAALHAVLLLSARRLIHQFAVTPAMGAFDRLPYGVHLAIGMACVAIRPGLVAAFTPQVFL